MTREKPTKLNTQISEEAAEWFIELRSGDLDAAGRRQFDAWVRSSPEHLRAYLEIAAIWNERDALAARRETGAPLPSLLTEPDNVVPIPAPGALPTASASQETGGRQTKRRAFLIAASVAALAVAGGATAWWQFHRATSYATDVGEQRLVRLRDGSTVELNSRSLVRVHFSDRERQVELIEGQALFHVAKDRARPFIVRSDALQVRAIGTQFDVNRKRSGTVVTVLEGRVAVSGAFRTTAVEPANPPPALSLGAGEQVTVTRKVVAQPVRTNVSAATAWTQHRLVFESAPLAEVAEEFNRYSPRALIVEDAASEPLRLSGVFSTDPDFLIRYLRERPDIAIRETATEIYITRN